MQWRGSTREDVCEERLAGALRVITREWEWECGIGRRGAALLQSTLTYHQSLAGCTGDAAAGPTLDFWTFGAGMNERWGASSGAIRGQRPARAVTGVCPLPLITNPAGHNVTPGP